ncbi:glycosyl transferase [Sulfolobales archaeon HS-7]|nr:glycosyl transferase [Sulfolobales archaeon HS-7]
MEEGIKMKLVHVARSADPKVGGIEKVVYELSTRLARKHDVTVVCTSSLDSTFRTVKPRSIKMLGINDITVPLEVPEELNDADLVHFHSQNSLFSLLLHKGIKNSVFTLMAIDSLADHPSLIKRTLGKLYSSWGLGIALNSKRLIVKNYRDSKIVRERWGFDPAVIEDGVDERYLATTRSPSQGDRYVLYVGRLERLKGVELLIRATKKINANVIIAGSGDVRYYQKMARREGVEGKVKFTGYVNEDEKIRLIDNSEAVIIPSISDYAEAYSIVLSEAWARGKAVVASSAGSLSYRIRHGENGFLFPKASESEMVRQINAVLASPELAQQVGEQGKKEVKTWEEVVRQHEELYRGILQ